MRKIALALTCLACSVMQAQQVPSPEVAQKIKKVGLEESRINGISYFMTDHLGSRLAASQQKLRAESEVVNYLKDMKLENVRTEFAQKFSKGGWDVERTYAAMTAPYYCALTVNPRAWSGSTDGLVRAECITISARSTEELERYRGKLKGKIVLMPAPTSDSRGWEWPDRYSDEDLEKMKQDTRARISEGGNSNSYYGNASSYAFQRELSKFIQEEKPIAIVHSSGNFNNPSGSGVSYKVGDPEPIPQLNMPAEHHGRMVRLLMNREKVEMELDIRNRFTDNQEIHNVIAEIPGTDKKLRDQVVLIGAHLDSWHGGTGANDNASGCIVMMEAMRILRESGIQPRRTIRLALWGGEEQGLYGSYGYREKYLYTDSTRTKKPGYEQFALYLNMDNGTGRFRGIYLERNDQAFPYFEAWMKPIESLGFTTLSPNRTGSTDHVAFDQIGLPAYQFIQDGVGYFKTYHTIMDTYERLSKDDLRINAVITAWLALCAANDDGRIPVK